MDFKRKVDLIFIICVVIFYTVFFNINRIYTFVIGDEYERFINNYDKIKKVYVFNRPARKYAEPLPLNCLDGELVKFFRLLAQSKEPFNLHRGAELNVFLAIKIEYESDNSNEVEIRISKYRNSKKFKYRMLWNNKIIKLYPLTREFSGEYDGTVNVDEVLEKLIDISTTEDEDS